MTTTDLSTLIWAKVPVEAIFDKSLPDPVFRTMCKWLAISHPYRYAHTPEMTPEELRVAGGLGCERTVWNHLRVLREMVHVSVESTRRGHYVIRWTFVDGAESAKVCTIPVVDSSHVTVEVTNGDQQQQSDLHGGGLGGAALSAKVCTLPPATVQNLALLGWVGSLDEVEAAYARDPEMVDGWLDAILRLPVNGRVRNRAAIFRQSLRSGARPPAAGLRWEDVATDASAEQATSAAETPADTLWQAVLDELEQETTRATFDTCLRGSRALSRNDGAIVVAASNPLARDLLDTRLRALVAGKLARLTGELVDVTFVVGA